MAVRLFAAGQRQDALILLREVLGENASSEVWSDWATVQFSLNAAGEAERGLAQEDAGSDAGSAAGPDGG